jgi:hypothetical protein
VIAELSALHLQTTQLVVIEFILELALYLTTYQTDFKIIANFIVSASLTFKSAARVFRLRSLYTQNQLSPSQHCLTLQRYSKAQQALVPLQVSFVVYTETFLYF